MDGAYNEKEAHESFQQALSEWRNGGNKNNNNNNNTNNTKKTQPTKIKSNNINNTKTNLHDSNVGTDTSDLGKKTQQSTIQELEKAIHSNHSLTYAERMLLQKYRRNDLEISMFIMSSQSSIYIFITLLILVLIFFN